MESQDREKGKSSGVDWNASGAAESLLSGSFVLSIDQARDFAVGSLGTWLIVEKTVCFHWHLSPACFSISVSTAKGDFYFVLNYKDEILEKSWRSRLSRKTEPHFPMPFHTCARSTLWFLLFPSLPNVSKLFHSLVCTDSCRHRQSQCTLISWRKSASALMLVLDLLILQWLQMIRGM
jgi:hypothetical protein